MDIEKIINDDDFLDYDSDFNNCYVFELSVEDTGEVFYVGYADPSLPEEHFCKRVCFVGSNNYYDAERIMKKLSTKKTILYTGLRESIAEQLAIREIERIKKETNYLLCDHMFNDYANDNYTYLKTPCFWISKVEQHYLGYTPVPYDEVDINNLSAVYLLDSNFTDSLVNDLYGNNYEAIYNEMKSKLQSIGTSIRTSRYAKTTKSWIITGNISLYGMQIFRDKIFEKYGIKMPFYHMLDVIDALKDISYKKQDKIDILNYKTNAINNRCPLENIENLDDIHAGGEYYFKGQEYLNAGKIEEAISYFDKAREKGNLAVYYSYLRAFKKIKDYDNELEILQELLKRQTYRFRNNPKNEPTFVTIKEGIERDMEKVIKKIEKKNNYLK